MEDDHTLGIALDLRALDDRRKEAVGIDRTYAARYGAVLREGLVDLVAHHAVVVLLSAQTAQVVADDAIGVGTVEVVGIDHGKGLVDHRRSHHQRVVRTPRLLTSFGHLEALGQILQLLIYHLNLDAAAETLGIEHLGELLGERVAYDEYDLAETGADGVVDRIVDDGLVVGADSVHLLQRAVARTHAGSEDKQCRFYHFYSLFTVISYQM